MRKKIWQICAKKSEKLQCYCLEFSVQGVKTLGGHLARLCWGYDCYEVKKNTIIFQKEKGNTFTLLIIFIIKSLQTEQKSTILLFMTPDKHAITPKWINS